MGYLIDFTMDNLPSVTQLGYQGLERRAVISAPNERTNR